MFKSHVSVFLCSKNAGVLFDDVTTTFQFAGEAKSRNLYVVPSHFQKASLDVMWNINVEMWSEPYPIL